MIHLEQDFPGVHCPLHWIAASGTKIPREIPAVPGIYYFLNQDQHVLYVGKSIHIRQRLLDHLAASQKNAKSEKLFKQTAFFAWRETVGDFHAQLMENREIKRLFPVYNRAQRKLKRFFSWRLYTLPHLQMILTPFDGEASQLFQTNAYGVFRNKRQAQEALFKLADEHGICLQMIGLEKPSQGRCFRAQIKKCYGACAGYESLETLQERLKNALLPWCFEAWPAAGPLLIPEGKGWHLVHQWQSFGVFDTKPSKMFIQKRMATADVIFEKDEYRIIQRLVRGTA